MGAKGRVFGFENWRSHGCFLSFGNVTNWDGGKGCGMRPFLFEGAEVVAGPVASQAGTGIH